MSATAHEHACQEAKQAWRLAFWQRVAEVRQEREARLLRMAGLNWLLSGYRIEDDMPAWCLDGAVFFRHTSRKLAESCEKILNLPLDPPPGPA